MSIESGVEDFRASMWMADLVAVNVVELEVSPSRVLRTARMVQREDPELVCVVMARSGKLVLSQSGREVVLQGADIALYDSSLPFSIQLGVGELATLVRAHVPRALLGLPAGGIERLLARPVPAGTGFAGLLVNFLSGLAAGSAVYRVDDIPRLARIAEDLLTALVAHCLDADGGLPEESRPGAFLLSVEAFIQQHLHDPDLSPRAIAAAHHVSVSHLHRVFSARDTSVGAWIRRLRLERARRDLHNLAQHDVPVHEIAARWGFKDHSTFTRSFRAAYGMTPRDYRHRGPETAPRT